MKYEYIFDPDKNRKLKNERGVGFEDIIALVDAGYLVDVVDNPNTRKYPSQRFYVVDVAGYIHLVPFVRDGHRIYLKTIYPSRKATRNYMGGKEVL